MVEPVTETPAAAFLESEKDFAGRQILGTRQGQEDCYGVVPPEELGDNERDLLVLVADGMGGHAAGEVASALAVETFALTFLEGGGRDDSTRLWDALETANKRIAEKIRASDGALDGMGTTILALLVRGMSARWISVGDSPLYLLRDGKVRRLNDIHSWAETLDEEAKAGMITEEQAKTDAARNTLMAALIGERLYEVDDSAALDLEPGDLLVATTDGVNTLDPAEIPRIATDCEEGDAASIAEGILDAVRERKRPKQDNATVVVVSVPPEPTEPNPPCNAGTGRS